VERVMIISSDGHASARMEEYRPYLEERFHDDFDAFLAVHGRLVGRDFERPGTLNRVGAEEYERWMALTGEVGRLDGAWDPVRRLVELEAEGIVGEILFPELRKPFDVIPTGLAGWSRSDLATLPSVTREHSEAGSRAYNRWLTDFCREAPARFAGMAVVDFTDVEAAIRDIRWAKDVGMRGVIIPIFRHDSPLFSPRYDPIWSLLEELELTANSHSGFSGVSDIKFNLADAPDPVCAIPMFSYQVFFERELLTHLVWGGVLERHPRLKVVFTEIGSDWVVDALRKMDFTYEGSYLRSDIRGVLPMKPSDYFARQCYVGSSVFSRAEVEQRDEIGLDRMLIGIDYPHHEGTFGHDTRAYLRATFGAAGVPEIEARRMLGETAAEVFGFDVAELAPIVERVGPRPEEILVAPTEDRFPRGDVKRPFV
jgi:predicted TIM-barrel fold metal-dependent hydrolase